MKAVKHGSNKVGVALGGLGLSLFAGLASAGPAMSYATSVPEPSVISMMAGGAAAIVILARLRGKK